MWTLEAFVDSPRHNLSAVLVHRWYVWANLCVPIPNHYEDVLLWYRPYDLLHLFIELLHFVIVMYGGWGVHLNNCDIVGSASNANGNQSARDVGSADQLHPLPCLQGISCHYLFWFSLYQSFLSLLLPLQTLSIWSLPGLWSPILMRNSNMELF